MNGFDNKHRTDRHVLCCVAALLLSFSIHAQPSSAYLKCEKWLTEKAETHRIKSEKMARGYDARLEKIVQRALDEASGQRSSGDEIRESVKRIGNWYSIPRAPAYYVDDAIEEFTAMDEDGPDFKCRDRRYLGDSYKQYRKAYERRLEDFEEGVKDRIALESLRDDEGLVVISFNSNKSKPNVVINRRNAVGGNIKFQPIHTGEHFRVYRARAGSYNWDEITKEMFGSEMIFDLSKLDYGFEVDAGKLNYAGVFVFDVRVHTWYSATLEDRLVVTLVKLEERYPELVRQYKIANGLDPDDRFTEFYLSEKSLFTSARASDDEE